MIGFALTTTARLEIMGVILLGLWLLLAAATATYGANRGFRFWPLFVCGIFIGFPWVLLAVTITTPLVRTARTETRTVDDAATPGEAMFPAA